MQSSLQCIDRISNLLALISSNDLPIGDSLTQHVILRKVAHQLEAREEEVKGYQRRHEIAGKREGFTVIAFASSGSDGCKKGTARSKSSCDRRKQFYSIDPFHNWIIDNLGENRTHP